MASGTTAGRAAELLHSTPIHVITDSLIRRSLLGDGRFESHEFGRNQHSSASAGAILTGLSGIRSLDDSTVAPIIEAGCRLVSPNGRVRGHDEDPGTGDTAWSQAQILLGLLTRPHLVTSHRSKLTALAHNLLESRTAEGGWALRENEKARILFSFYPVLAITRAYQEGMLRPGWTAGVMVRVVDYLVGSAAEPSTPLEERLLAHVAVQRLVDSLNRTGAIVVPRREHETMRSCWSPETGLTLQDRAIVLTSQPVWHSIMWRPLLYMCARTFSSPLSPVNCLLAAELLEGYDPDLMAWSGPSDGMNKGTGSSWASALALRTTTAIASDLVRQGISTEVFRQRVEELQGQDYKYDVAISFAGQDRGTAETIVGILQEFGVRVFYDRQQQHSLLGEDLSTVLHSTYLNESRYAVVLVSRAFIESRWAGNWEWKAVLARMQRQSSGYVLPYIMEDVALPGLSPTLGYVDAKTFPPEDFARLVVRKLYG